MKTHAERWAWEHIEHPAGAIYVGWYQGCNCQADPPYECRVPSCPCTCHKPNVGLDNSLGGTYELQPKDIPPGTIRYCFEGHALDVDNMTSDEQLIHELQDQAAQDQRVIVEQSAALIRLGMHTIGKPSLWSRTA